MNEELPPAWLPAGRAWKKTDGSWADGYEHKRENGMCQNCGASSYEYHYALRSQARNS